MADTSHPHGMHTAQALQIAVALAQIAGAENAPLDSEERRALGDIVQGVRLALDRAVSRAEALRVVADHFLREGARAVSLRLDAIERDA